MRVAMMGDYPYDPYHIGGGVEAITLYLLRGLQQFDDLELHMIVLRPDIKGKVISHDDIMAHYLNSNYRRDALSLGLYHKRLLKRELHRIKPDIIHAHIAGIYPLAAFDTGIPTVLSLHGIRRNELALRKSWRDRTYRRWIISRQENISVRGAKYIIATSPPYIRQEFNDIIHGQIFDIENPVKDTFFKVQRQEKRNRILFAGHIKVRKGVMELLQAIDLLRHQVPAIQVRLAGRTDIDIPYMTEVQNYITDHKLENNVQLLGSLNEEELLKEYAECALLVLPSRQETAPMVIEQAMAARVPVVATRVGGVDYMVNDGRTGFVVEFGDIQGLAAAMEKILTDDELRVSMGDNGRKEAEQRFRAEVVARQTRAVYDQILNHNHR